MYKLVNVKVRLVTIDDHRHDSQLATLKEIFVSGKARESSFISAVAF